MKDLYIAILEEIMAELVEAGMDEDEAYEKAGDMAYDEMRERLADQADYLRKRKRETP